MEQVLEVVVNGQSRSVRVNGAPTLASALVALDLKLDRIAVERNGRIVRRTAWDGTEVQSGDKLEIVHFVGGGAC